MPYMYGGFPWRIAHFYSKPLGLEYLQEWVLRMLNAMHQLPLHHHMYSPTKMTLRIWVRENLVGLTNRQS